MYAFSEEVNRRHLIILTGISVVLLLGCSSSKIMNQPLSGAVDLQGHRGARGLRPENTIAAFEFGIRNHMTTIELDTNVTKDRHLIVYHDSQINSALCLDKDGNPAAPVHVKDLNLAALKELDCGSLQNEKFPEQVPIEGTRLISLAEFFDFVKSYEEQHEIHPPLKFNVEMKLPEDASKHEMVEAAQIMVRTIEDAGVRDRTTIQSFSPEAISEVKAIGPKFRTSALFEPTRFNGLKLILGLNADRYAIVEHALDAGADIISPYYLYVTSEFVQHCHLKNIEVLPWTVNKEKTMKKMLDYGVDGIISDYPDRLHRVFIDWETQRKKLPKP